jgi:MSHA pilin protein MshC
MNYQRGFTIVELVMTIVIIGILAAVVGPRFFDRQVFDERLLFEETLAAFRYSQKLALAGGCPILAGLDGDGYRLTWAGHPAGGCPASGTPVANPAGGVYALSGVPSGAVVDGLIVTFDSRGLVGGGGQARIGSHRFTVHPSGFVEREGAL